MSRALIRRIRPRDERGFSLTELLVAMLVGMVVLLAAFMVLDRSFSASGQIADRTDALQRGRLTSRSGPTTTSSSPRTSRPAARTCWAA